MYKLTQQLIGIYYFCYASYTGTPAWVAGEVLQQLGGENIKVKYKKPCDIQVSIVQAILLYILADLHGDAQVYCNALASLG